MASEDFLYLGTINSALRENLANEKMQYMGNIFHYTSASGFLNIVEKQKIWFSNLKYLNDNSELNYIYSLFPKKASDLNLNNDFFELICNIKKSIEHKNEYRFLDNDFCQKDFYVASFSKDSDCLELWNYYTKSDDSIGYNLEFNTNCLFLINHYHIQGSVIYEEDEQRGLLNNILEKYNQFYIKNEITSDFNNEKNKIFIKNFIEIIELYNLFFKHPKFKNEKEFRFVIYDPDEYFNTETGSVIKPNFIKHRVHKGLLIPYMEIPYTNRCLKAVSISPNNDNILFQNGVKNFLDKQNLYSVKITSSNIPKRY